MKTLKPTLLAITLIVTLSSTALAGNIGGLRTTGNIGGMRSAGNIGGMRSAGNIAGLRNTGSGRVGTAPETALGTSKFDLEHAFSGTLSGLIRLLLESGALL